MAGLGKFPPLLVLLSVLCLIISPCSAERYHKFRCQRSIDQMESLKPKHIPGVGPNCQLGRVNVLEAKAEPDRTADGTAAMRFSLSGTLEAPMLKPRFTLSMRSMEAKKTINYLGFDDNGYDMCCEFAKNATCEWEKESEATDALNVQVVKQCIFHSRESAFEASQEAHGRGLYWEGSVVKPLHALKPGLWEVKFTIADGFGSNLGRVVAYTELLAEDLEPAKPNLSEQLVIVDEPQTEGGEAAVQKAASDPDPAPAAAAQEPEL